jgi:hypothetical protein
MNSIDVLLVRAYGCARFNSTRARPRPARRLVVWMPLQVVVLMLARDAIASGPSAPGPCPESMPFDGPAPASMRWKDPTLSPDSRAKQLVAAMTLNEKIELVTGTLCPCTTMITGRSLASESPPSRSQMARRCARHQPRHQRWTCN